MGNGEPSGSGGRRNWRVDVAGGVGGAAGGALAMLVGNLADLRGFWPGLLVFLLGLVAGAVLGRLAGSLLFRGPPANGTRA